MGTVVDYLAISEAMYVKVGDTPIAPVGWSLVPGSLMVVVQNGTMAAVFKNNTANEYVVGAQGTYRNKRMPSHSSLCFSNSDFAVLVICSNSRPTNSVGNR